MAPDKHVDESWKDSVANEKDTPIIGQGDAAEKPSAGHPVENIEVTFFNYLTSLVFQAMIFLGELPHPLEQDKLEVNLPQAKMLIDTLGMLREKTKGNLTKEEEDFLNGAVYELQMKYIEITKKSTGNIQ